MRFSVDSNVLIYAEGVEDARRRDIAVEVVDRLGPDNIVLPLQSAGEMLRWLIRKGGFDRPAAVRKIEAWLSKCTPLPMTVSAFRSATSLVEHHAFQLWDAVILATSAEAEASVLLSEDMQHGFHWSGVTIVNPFVLTSDELRRLVPPRTIH